MPISFGIFQEEGCLYGEWFVVYCKFADSADEVPLFLFAIRSYAEACVNDFVDSVSAGGFQGFLRCYLRHAHRGDCLCDFAVKQSNDEL